MVVGPGFRIFVSQESGLAFLRVKGPGKGSPWRGPTHLNLAGIQSWREPTRAKQPSQRTPIIPPKSGRVREARTHRAPTESPLHFPKPRTPRPGSGGSGRKAWRPCPARPARLLGPQRRFALGALAGPNNPPGLDPRS